MRWCWLFVLTGCTLSPTCPTGDHRCLFASLTVSTSERDPKLPLTKVSALTAPDAGTLRLGGPELFELDPNGETLTLAFEGGAGCQPAFCFSMCAPGTGPCAADAVCIPPVKNGLSAGLSAHWVDLDAQPVGNTSFDLVVTPLNGPGCPDDVAARFVDGDSSVVVGRPAVIAATALRRPKATAAADAGQSCLQASTLVCTPNRFGGSRSRCITRTEYEEATGLPLPTAPAPDGTFGCFDEANNVLVKPCLPTSTCRVGFECGGGSVAGGVCNP